MNLSKKNWTDWLQAGSGSRSIQVTWTIVGDTKYLKRTKNFRLKRQFKDVATYTFDIRFKTNSDKRFII